MKSIAIIIRKWKDEDIDFEEVNDDLCLKVGERRISLDFYKGGVGINLYLTNNKNFELSLINKKKRPDLTGKKNRWDREILEINNG